MGERRIHPGLVPSGKTAAEMSRGLCELPLETPVNACEAALTRQDGIGPPSMNERARETPCSQGQSKRP